MWHKLGLRASWAEGPRSKVHLEHVKFCFVVCIALHLPYCLERRNIKSRKNSLHIKREKGIHLAIYATSNLSLSSVHFNVILHVLEITEKPVRQFVQRFPFFIKFDTLADHLIKPKNQNFPGRADPQGVPIYWCFYKVPAYFLVHPLTPYLV